MTVSRFFLRPLDVAFFGPPEAQSAGETHFARSLFPMPPRAFQGVVRTRLLQTADPPLRLNDYSRAAMDERAALVGEADQLPAGWQIKGPLAVQSKGGALVPWLPAPEMLRRAGKASEPRRVVWNEIAEADEAMGGVYRARQGDRPRSAESAEQQGSLARGALGVRGFDDEGALGGWITPSNLEWALSGAGSWDPEGHCALPPMVRRERRTGVALEYDDGGRRAQDHMLYTREEIRFDGRGGFVGELSADLPSRLSESALTQGTVAVGRGHRLGELTDAPTLHASWERLVSGDHLPRAPAEGTLFWLVLLTPARLIGPLRPELEGIPDGHGVRILDALLGSPLHLGGYSMAERRARDNRRYLPAGSAWLFDVPGVAPDERGVLLQQLNGSHCLGNRAEAQMGFGRVMVGLARSRD